MHSQLVGGHSGFSKLLGFLASELDSVCFAGRSRALRSERELVAGEDEYDPKHENIVRTRGLRFGCTCLV